MTNGTGGRVDQTEPTDGRRAGDWKSRYPNEAWRRIWWGLGYLASLFFLVSAVLLLIGISLTHSNSDTDSATVPLIGIVLDRDILRWLSVAFAGMLGGLTFDLKWLYHSVAKHLWNYDRCLWRMIVPFIAGVVSIFLAFMIVSGIVPFIKRDSFNSLYFGLGFGFLFGYFSDNVLAALNKFADGAFGRTDPPGTNGT